MQGQEPSWSLTAPASWWPGTLWAQGYVPHILPGHSGSSVLPRGGFQGQLHRTVVSRCCGQMHSPRVGLSSSARPEAASALRLSVFCGGAVTWCHRSPLARCPAGAVSLDVAPRLPASFPLPASGSALALPSLPASPSPAAPSACSGICARPPPRFRRPPRLPRPARLTLPHPLSGPSGSHGRSPTPMPVLSPVCPCSFILTLGPNCCWRLFSPAGLGRWRQ